MTATCSLRTKAGTCVLCWAVFLLRLPDVAGATTVTNYLGMRGWLDGRFSPQYSLAVNVGDTVVWVNQPILGWPPTNYVESYGGEWKSPPMKLGESFSFTFINAGFYAYRMADDSDPRFGTVTVNTWTDAPPAVTINAPVDGSVILGGLVQASATNAENLEQIQFFANSDFIGSATNAPFAVMWDAPQGHYVLLAKAIDRQGGITWSLPVNVTVGGLFQISGARLLPTGEMLFFYNAISYQTSGYISASDGPVFTNNACFLYNYLYLGRADCPGVFVDESVRGGGVQRRFYKVIHGSGGSCP